MFDAKPGEKIRVTLLAEGSMLTAYVNDIAFTTRMYNYKGNGFGFYVQHGAADFSGMALQTE